MIFTLLSLGLLIGITLCYYVIKLSVKYRKPIISIIIKILNKSLKIINHSKYMYKIKVNITKYLNKSFSFKENNNKYISLFLIFIVLGGYLYSNIYIFYYNTSNTSLLLFITCNIKLLILIQVLIFNIKKKPDKSFSIWDIILFIKNNKIVMILYIILCITIRIIILYYFHSNIELECNSNFSRYLVNYNILISTLFIIKYIIYIAKEKLAIITNKEKKNNIEYIPIDMELSIYNFAGILITFSIFNIWISPIIIENFNQLILIVHERFNRFNNDVKSLISIFQDLYNKNNNYMKFLEIVHEIRNKYNLYEKSLIWRWLFLWEEITNKFHEYIKYKSMVYRRVRNLHLLKYKFTLIKYQDVKIQKRIWIPMQNCKIFHIVKSFTLKDIIIKETMYANKNANVLNTNIKITKGLSNETDILLYDYNKLNKEKNKLIVNFIKTICDIDSAIVSYSSNSEFNFYYNDKANPVFSFNNNNIYINSNNNIIYGINNEDTLNISNSSQYKAKETEQDLICRYNAEQGNVIHENTTNLCEKGTNKLLTWSQKYNIDFWSLKTDIINKEITCKKMHEDLNYTQDGFILHASKPINLENIIWASPIGLSILRILRFVADHFYLTYDGPEPVIEDNHVIALQENIDIQFFEIKNKLNQEDIDNFSLAIKYNRDIGLSGEAINRPNQIVLFSQEKGYKLFNQILDITRKTKQSDLLYLPNIPDYWHKLDNCANSLDKNEEDIHFFSRENHDKNPNLCKQVLDLMYHKRNPDILDEDLLVFISNLNGEQLTCSYWLYMYPDIEVYSIINTPHLQFNYSPLQTESEDINFLLRKIAGYCSDYMRAITCDINIYKKSPDNLLAHTKICNDWNISISQIAHGLRLFNSDLDLLVKLIITVDSRDLDMYLVKGNVNNNLIIFNNTFFFDLINRMYRLDFSKLHDNKIYVGNYKNNFLSLSFDYWQVLDKASNIDFANFLEKQVTIIANRKIPQDNGYIEVDLSDLGMLSGNTPAILKLKKIFPRSNQDKDFFAQLHKRSNFGKAIIYSNYKLHDNSPGNSIIDRIRNA